MADWLINHHVPLIQGIVFGWILFTVLMGVLVWRWDYLQEQQAQADRQRQRMDALVGLSSQPPRAPGFNSRQVGR